MPARVKLEHPAGRTSSSRRPGLLGSLWLDGGRDDQPTSATNGFSFYHSAISPEPETLPEESCFWVERWAIDSQD
jgi:hypothetical protein